MKKLKSCLILLLYYNKDILLYISFLYHRKGQLNDEEELVQSQVVFYIYCSPYITQMQIQKHLFRISQKTLKNQHASLYWSVIFYLLAAASMIFSFLFIFAHLMILPNNIQLTKCSQQAAFKFVEDTVNIVTDSLPKAQQIVYYKTSKQVLYDGSQCMIIQNRNGSFYDDIRFEVGWDKEMVFMDKEKRAKMNYNNFTFILKQIAPLRKWLFNYENLLINQLLDNSNDVFPNQYPYVKSRTAYIYHHRLNAISSVQLKIQLLLGVILNFFIISVVTSLYIYGTIIAAPAVIIMFLKCCNYLRNQNLNQVYKIFPWIGIHSLVRETSQNPNIKNSSMQICKSILFYFLFLYLVYYASIIWVDKTLFYSHVQLGIQELLFGYVALIEFAAIVFMRTRSFIKYFPTFHSILVIILLYYGQISVFGFKKIACYATFCISGALFAWMVLKLQIPSQVVWDRNQPYTPTIDKPRIGYFPIFNMSWISNLPDEWTMMVPLFGRQNFTPRQMALVDRNFEQLGVALGNPV